MFAVIDIGGGPLDRGRQYGESAREQVQRSVSAYEEVFRHYTGWSQAKVRQEAEAFRPAIAGFGQPYLDEILGIAEAAGAHPSDILAINVRTELMFAAEARRVAASGGPPAECSAFAVLAGRAGGALLVGQNWDWLEHAAETTVVLRCHQADGPAFVTVVEAGLLAKAGMNAAGVAIGTNLVVSDSDRGEPGVPYHVMLRALLDAPSPARALAVLQAGPRSSSANYLLAGEEVALDVEAFPGGYGNLYLHYPEDDLLLHFNHFCHPEHRCHDVSLAVAANSPFRQARMEQLVREREGPLDLSFWTSALGDHAMYPEAICHHPDPGAASAPERQATVASLVMEPASRRVWLAAGNPCSTPFEQLDTDILHTDYDREEP